MFSSRHLESRHLESRHLKLPARALRATGLLTLLAPLATLIGCQGIAGSPTLAQVRIIDASPDAPAFDAYEGRGPLAHNLAFGTITSYIPVSAGSSSLSVNTSGSSQLLATSRASFAGSGQYTALIGNIAGALQETILKDQSTPAPAGMVALRFVDQATRSGPIDIYLQPPGARLNNLIPIVTNAIFGSNSGYLNVPAGTYTLVMVPGGASPATPTATSIATFTGNQVSYPSGAVRTVILLDQQLPNVTGFQVITAVDVDSPNAL